MKYIVILGDGMADYPIEQLGNRTPLQVANKPNMDYLAQHGRVGLVKTTPDGMKPGSDNTNMGIMGFDPLKYYTGRSPLEAMSMGISMKDSDVSYRVNLVTLGGDEEYSNKTMLDYSADEISTEESGELIRYLAQHFNDEHFTLYPGISYRHCMIWANGETGQMLTPPHDILEQNIAEYLPKGSAGNVFFDMMRRSYELLKDHPVNKARMQRGLKPANSIWPWGEGKRPAFPSFEELHGKKGAVISAVDLIKGIGICAGMRVMEVEGATGNIHTNFKGKAEAALDALKDGADYVYLHVEAPDECGHRQEIESKVRAIELIDEHIVGRILREMKEAKQEFRMLLMPDHPTPLMLRTHTSDAVPFVLYASTQELQPHVEKYDEGHAKATGIFEEHAYKLIDFLMDK
ncbi:cofactor-independent phosphoglycerate mutase [Clostridia bacterium OttesenSCG-928-F22]|nr:cofactor-independent phosphoglycerate mutase [Clostridia bacterium OttesenSCG-928-F22]